MNNSAFIYESFWGSVFSYQNDTVFGYENVSIGNNQKRCADIPEIGGVFGYVHSGSATLKLKDGVVEVRQGWWFSTENGLNLTLSENTKLVAIQHYGYVGIDSIGKVEHNGRLGYIDGCTNSLLAGPHKKGEPVLNGLFMPPGINQTMHTHPSLRAGIIISGEAECNTPTIVDATKDYSIEQTECNVLPLKPGLIFVLKPECWHKFRTDTTKGDLRLIAYHPDSDFGPTDEESPMLNRTMVGDEENKDSIKHRTEHLTINLKNYEG